MKSNTNTKLILFHPSITSKSAATAATHHRLWFFFFLSFFTIAFSLTLFSSSLHSSSSSSSSASSASPSFPPHVAAALLHYAAVSASNSSMSLSELSAVSAAVRSVSGRNLLVFGLSHESLLWRSINFAGRTVFVDENSYAVSKFEQANPGVEAYDVVFSTRVSQAGELLRYYRTQHECRPVQNLLFSDCKLGINDLPNFVYETDWDVILVDGPSGFSGESPGRMSAIFTAAVLARSKRDVKSKKKTDVFVHEFGRKVERVYSEEFLCKEKLVEVVGELAHFSVAAEEGGAGSPEEVMFCRNSKGLSENFAPVTGGDDEDGGVESVDDD
ncbi:PREDICTED: protein IRX15-LIKE-like [Tarenaya hassleriana]|uniref:protein IRX15-LIKE-like n=1 Tax=Tarenaya hassleriana TaxID=28532 RepID=UPI00053C193B|nr:PREDICTED: protein IRX15-LIKE-like [Tarenaya hassleriana]